MVAHTQQSSRINALASVYPGADEGRFGNRKPPTVAYATYSPVLHYDAEEGLFLGGNFWDGRATGWLLGEPAAEQAQGPFLNPVEQNLGNPSNVVNKVCNAAYGDQFRAVFGRDICQRLVDAYNAIGQAIFTRSGYMSAQLMRAGRPAFASGDQAGGTDQEIRAALQGYAAYYGQCEIDEENKTLVTRVEGSLFPNWVGSRQLRYYEFSGSQLILKTTPIAFGEEEFTGVLTWERR